MSPVPFSQQQVSVAGPGCHHVPIAISQFQVQVKLLVLIGTTDRWDGSTLAEGPGRGVDERTRFTDRLIAGAGGCRTWR